MGRKRGRHLFCKNHGIAFPVTPKLGESISALSIPRLPLDFLPSSEECQRFIAFDGRVLTKQGIFFVGF